MQLLAILMPISTAGMMAILALVAMLILISR
jgi:hypothetical protein